MKYRTSTSNSSNLRIFIVSLLAYVLLTSQLVPLAVAANAKLNRATDRRATISIADESSGAAQPISGKTQFAPVPKPLPPTVPAMVPLAVNIVATKTDNRTVAQPAAPGDTINYTVVIQNLGSTDATNVNFTDTIDANTTLVPNSIVSTPVANNDTYNVIGNVRIQPNAAQGLLTNDFNPDNGNATGITASGPATSTQGGNVTVNADGSFSYNPAAGFAGTDTFTYTLTVTATGKTDTATVTLNVGNGTATPGTNVIWFINSSASPGGDGRFTSPFNCFVGAGCFSAVAADDPGDAIFLFNGAYIGGYSLLANQKLIGQGAGATLASLAGVTVQAYSDALPATNGNPDNVTMTTVAAATNALTVSAGGILLRGFTIGNTTGAKIFGSSFGTLTAGNTTTPDLKLNGTGQALNLTTGTFAATSAFTSVATTSSATQGITLAGVGGTVAFGSTTVSGATTQGILIGTTTANINFGNTTVTGGTDAISLQNNSAGTRTFGTVTTSGNTGIGFLHSVGGGLTSITGATTITNPGSTGISIQNSTTAISFAGTTVNKGASAGAGVDLGNNTGNTTFNSLSITTLNGTGLLGVGNTGQINVTTNAGSIAATGGAAINISKVAPPATPVTLNFGTVSSTNSTTLGVNLDRVSGNLTNTTTTTTNPTGIGIQVLNSGAGTLNFGNTTSNTSGGAGVSLASNAGAVTFADLDIAPDANVVAFSASNNTGLITSTTGTISTTDAPAVSVTNSPLSMILTSVSADNTGDADSCVSLTTVSGTLNMQGGSLVGGTGAAFFVSGGNPTATYSGSITQNSAGRVVDIQGTTGNTITFNTGTITGGASSTGIHIGDTTVVNGNVSFANLNLGTVGARMTNQAVTITGGTGTYSLGAVSIFTNNAQGLNATNADGTLNIPSGTVDSSNATAINIDGPAGLTTLGITLTRVDSSGGTANGISIQDTNGSFTVNGDGANTAVGGNSTGGIISGKAGADGNNAQGNGVFLSNALAITLRRMTINGTNQNHGIRGISVTNFTLEFSTVSGTNGTSAALDEGAVNFDNMLGTGAITSCVIEGGLEDNLNVVNTSGTLNRLTISGSTFGLNNTASGNNNILIESQNAGTTLNFTLKSSLIKGARADFINASNNSSSIMDAVIGGPLVADGNTFDNLAPNAHPGAASGGNRVVFGAVGVQTVDIRNNTMKGSKGEAIRLRSTATGALTGAVDGRVRNNTIGVAGTANSGSSEGSGIFIFVDGGGDADVAITNNSIFQYNNHAINLQAGDEINDGTVFNATVTGNIANTPGNINTDFNGIQLNHGTVLATDNFTGCVDIGGAGLQNNVVGSGAIPPNNASIRLRQRQTTTVRLPGYGGANNNDAAVVTYLLGRNTVATAAASNTVATGGGGFIGGAACTAPIVPLAPEIFDENPAQLRAPGGSETPAVAQEPITVGRLDTLKAGVLGVVSPSESSAQMFVPEAGVRGKVETSEGKQNTGKLKGKDVDVITPSLANFPLTIGTLGAGKSVTITFSVTVNNPLVPPTTTSVSNQGTVSGNDGATPFNALTDDPDVAGTNNPTVTGITPPPDINIKDAKGAEPPSGTSSMLFAVTLSVPALGPVSVNYATADGGATPATGGTCGVAGVDYATSNGTVNFVAGQQMQTVAIPVCADATVEPDETFLVNLSTPTNGIIVDGQAIGTITTNTPGVTLISELRTSGPSGAADEFVETYNNTDSPLTVTASDASSGYGLYKMGAACGDTPVLLGTIPNGTVIPARGHYLFVGSAYSLANYGGTGAAAGNLTMTSDIENDRNVALFNTSNVLNISSATRLDAVGFGANTGNNCDLLREGTNLAVASGSTSQHSFVRKLTTGLPQDTNDNLADFAIVATDPTVAIGGNPLPILGAPGPENVASPLQRNATIKASLIDTGAASTAPPNRVRDLTPYNDLLTPSAPNGGAPATNPYPLGTLLIRRKFTNNTGGSVTRLRFRIVDITSTNAPPGGAGQADLRTLSSVSASVSTTCCGTVPVQGLTLEQVPTQARGGGLNSTVSAGTITLGTPLTNGASINLNFLMGVQLGGGFRFFINVEALP